RSPTLLSSHKSATYASSSSFLTATPTSEIYTLSLHDALPILMARKNLPTIPTVLARILQLADAENTSGKELIAVVEHDQALTGKMLRLANSAFFGQSRRVAAIPRAVVLLGFTTVRNLALGVKVWDVLGAGIARSRVDELWTHAVAVALATRSLAVRLRTGDPDEGFTAGLLHDVGG